MTGRQKIPGAGGTRGPWPALIVVLGLTFATGRSLAAAAPVVRGDLAAWAEIVGAYKRLNALPGYRVKIIVSLSGGRIVERGTLEAAYPNVRHIKLQTLQNTIEGIDAGTTFRVLVNASGYPSGWQCTGTPQTRPLDDPQDIRGGLTVTRAGGTSVAGTPMRAYLLSSGAPPSTVTHTLYVGAPAGLPRREVVIESDGSERTTYFDYYDYGARIAVPLSSCQ